MRADERAAGGAADLIDIEDRLRPSRARQRALGELDSMFRSGRTPEPRPDSFLRGRLVTTSTTPPLDAFGRRMADLWMPWLGKRFDASTDSGVNVLSPSAGGPMRVLWRNYQPERVLADRIEAFPFRNRIAPGELDPDVQVLKIDYDFEANPDLIIRKVLDELVQIDEHTYLGKILYRTRKGFRQIGYFSLHS